MKIISLLVLTFSSITFANLEVECVESPLEKMAKEISIPNCISSTTIIPAKRNNTKKLCDECRPEFILKSNIQVQKITKKEKQKLFLEAALKEYQKNITNKLVDALKMRSLRPTGSTLENSIKQCSLRSSKDFSTNCNSKAAQGLLEGNSIIENFNESIKSELARNISQHDDYKPQNAILKRNESLCFIPEKDVLFLSVTAVEEVMNIKMIESILAMEETKLTSVEEIFVNPKVKNLYEGEKIDELFDALYSHPLLNQKIQSPASLFAFLKSVPTPRNTENLRKALYNKKNGEDFDKKMSESCKSNFEELQKAICSKDFEDGNIDINAFENYSKLFSKEIEPINDEFVATEDLQKANIDILRLCEDQAPKALTLSKTNEIINKDLPQQFKSKQMEDYRVDKYELDFGFNTINLCENKNKDCSKNSISCKTLQNYKEYLKKDSLTYKLASSSNPEVNNLLRAMIGSPSTITDPKTNEILILAGVIPAEDGKIIAQPDIPERKPDFFAKPTVAQSATSSMQAAQAPKVTAQGSQKSAPDFYEKNFDRYDNSPKSTQPSPEVPEMKDVVQNANELKNIQDEIRRRLNNMNPRETNQQTVKKAIKDSFESRGQELTPSQVETLYERTLPSAPQTIAAAPIERAVENRAVVSGGPTAKQVLTDKQKNAALMGMAGAQALENLTTRSPSSISETQKKDLTKVALNFPEDRTVKLSDIFTDKLNRNDPETQLLKVLFRSKNDFILQVKSVNFKIMFSGINQFHVLVDSGDKKIAEDLKPQLEIFLKKLKT